MSKPGREYLICPVQKGYPGIGNPPGITPKSQELLLEGPRGGCGVRVGIG